MIADFELRLAEFKLTEIKVRMPIRQRKLHA